MPEIKWKEIIAARKELRAGLEAIRSDEDARHLVNDILDQVGAYLRRENELNDAVLNIIGTGAGLRELQVIQDMKAPVSELFDSLLS